MYDERVLASLRSTMPEYLRAVHGVDVEALRGRPFRCLHPDHEDHEPSMRYYEDSHRVHCFSCGANADVFEVAEWDGATGFAEQVRRVADVAGCQLDGQAAADGLPSYRRKFSTRPLPQPDAPDLSSRCYEAFDSLFEPQAAAALDYLHGRGFKDQEISLHGFGWTADPHGLWDAFSGGLRASDGFLVLPFPDEHWAGVHYAVVRPIGGGAAKEYKPKGVAAPLWHESALSRPGSVYVTEGVFDAVALALLLDVAPAETVALMGTQNVRRLLEVLETTPEDQRPDVVLILDSDEAGARATDKACEGLQLLNVKHKAVTLPDGVKDANDWLLECEGGDGE